MSQGQLFDTDPAPWEADDQADQRVARVVFAEGAAGEFDYSVPEDLRDHVEAGRRLRVPLGRGNRTVIGWCVQIDEKPATSRRLKPVRAVIDTQPLLTPALLRMTRWMANYYLCEWGQAIECALPSGVRQQAGTREVTLLSVPTSVAARLTQLKLPKKQALALKILAGSPRPLTPHQLAEAADCTLAPINGLRKKGLVRGEVKRVQHGAHEEAATPREAPHDLNGDQQSALDTILERLRNTEYSVPSTQYSDKDTSSPQSPIPNSKSAILVHGVTGSGKTEVYIRAIEEVVSYGRQAIVLVPEISLTPQTRQRFRSRFDEVAVLHSHLTPRERHWHWQRIAAGEVQVVVGARSAVFAPTPHLGLIVIDEEHDASFKQDNVPRYHARDVALWRAREEGVPLVLGSATPSLESYHLAQEGEFQLVEMPRRVLDRPLPPVRALDLRLEFRDRRSRGAISRQLYFAMKESIDKGEQVILLLNRRGFSTQIQCPACGHVVQCPDCDIALTHHRDQEKALCHYCEYVIPVPDQCPECSATGIYFRGLGTQKLEDEVRKRFPSAKCLRMDSDTMQAKGAHEEALARFRSGDVQILLGTQMIAKGLDFPNVTLVGVVNADSALHFPDFRAAERTFNLVTQVAGRTGRGEKGGSVLVQTFSPDHVAVSAAVEHDYQAFAAAELPERKEYGYPPFASMARIVVRGESELTTEQFAEHIAQQVEAAGESAGIDMRLLGPAEAPIAKLRGKYRFHMLLQHTDSLALRDVVRVATADLKPPDDIQWIVDIDPLDML